MSWEFYDRFSDGDRNGENCRVAYDGNDGEIIGIGPFHDLLQTLVDYFIAIVSDELVRPQRNFQWPPAKSLMFFATTIGRASKAKTTLVRLCCGIERQSWPGGNHRVWACIEDYLALC